MAAVIEHPIINSPYAEPAWHWELDERGQPTGERVPGRRPRETWMPVPRARKGRNGQLVAEIKGLDIYNPTAGDVRAEGPDDIMMWSIDTDYDAEAFIVRHVYFSGENGKSTGLNPYERLGKALKGQIDEEALATLFATKSRPFPKPESGRIAVKVINYYGDEVLKAIEV